MTAQPKARRPCVQCGRTVQTRTQAPTCTGCAPRVFGATEANREAAYCELCGRVHAGRWECVERSERSGEEVRLWLLERGEL